MQVNHFPTRKKKKKKKKIRRPKRTRRTNRTKKNQDTPRKEDKEEDKEDKEEDKEEGGEAHLAVPSLQHKMSRLNFPFPLLTRFRVYLAASKKAYFSQSAL